MNNTSDESDFYSIGEASERTGLPESTIRFYDREFSDYLSIERGDNNQRIFSEENLKDLEYIRFLIKRENMSVEDVAQRLEREINLKNRHDELPEETGDNEQNHSDNELRELNESIEQLTTEIHELRTTLNRQEDVVSNLQENQENMLKLLDMNLQRYNELVNNLPS